jgi:hypothetical protein
VIVDLVGAATRHDLVTAASLFGVDKKAIGDGGLLRAVAYKKQQEAEEEREGVLVARTVDLFRRRSIHWIIVKPGEQFAISCGDRLIALTKFGQRQRWDAQVFINGTFIRNLASDTDLAFVQGVAEEYAKGRDAGPLNNPKARWRRKPASEKQIKALRAWGAEREIHPEMTAGEASDILSVVIGLRGGRRGA